MEHHLMHKIGSLFPSPFTSCKSKILPDVAENSISIPQAFHNILLQPFPKSKQNHSPSKTHQPKVSKNHSHQPLDSKTKTSSSSNSGWFSTASDKEGDEFHRKIDKCFNFSSCSSESFRRRFDCKIIDDLGRCPSAISSNQICNLETNRKSTAAEKEKSTQPASIPTKKVYKKTKILNKVLDFKEPLTELYYSSYPKDGRRKTKKGCKKSLRKGVPAVGSESKRHLIGADDNDGIKESIAVEKSSSDPYGDFRKSMVEMIVEKRIFGAKNLYKLLECFLSLNSPYYHQVILEVFIEICDTLFSN